MVQSGSVATEQRPWQSYADPPFADTNTEAGVKYDDGLGDLTAYAAYEYDPTAKKDVDSLPTENIATTANYQGKQKAAVADNSNRRNSYNFEDYFSKTFGDLFSATSEKLNEIDHKQPVRRIGEAFSSRSGLPSNDARPTRPILRRRRVKGASRQRRMSPVEASLQRLLGLAKLKKRTTSNRTAGGSKKNNRRTRMGGKRRKMNKVASRRRQKNRRDKQPRRKIEDEADGGSSRPGFFKILYHVILHRFNLA